ncbi:hypothetical protein AGMMS49921_03710 [Endomicrobiia bacterium]|nr:hypothetical protein AGMMS49921_03710 [Endomicrobiia bacterium]
MCVASSSSSTPIETPASPTNTSTSTSQEAERKRKEGEDAGKAAAGAEAGGEGGGGHGTGILLANDGLAYILKTMEESEELFDKRKGHIEAFAGGTLSGLNYKTDKTNLQKTNKIVSCRS